jgi:hypothetical protein
MDGSSDQRPPDHSLVDVDTPCSKDVSDQESITQALEDNIIVVFTV